MRKFGQINCFRTPILNNAQIEKHSAHFALTVEALPGKFTANEITAKTSVAVLVSAWTLEV